VRIFKSLVVVLLAASSASAQGIVISMREMRGTQTSTTQMQFDATHVRTEVRQGADPVTVVFDGSAQVLRLINPVRKSYSELTQAEAQQMGQQLSTTLAMMQAQLAKLPPEQRKIMEDMLKGRGGRGLPGLPGADPSAAERTTYTRTGTSKVGQWPCTTYDGLRGTEKVSEICAARGSDFGLTAADFQVTRQLSDFLRSLLPQVADDIALFGSAEEQGFSGFPVRRTTFSNGQPVSTTELIEVKREAIPESMFTVPAGFTKESIFSGLGRGGANR
jgi:hypothetical protein